MWKIENQYCGKYKNINFLLMAKKIKNFLSFSRSEFQEKQKPNGEEQK